MNFRLRLSSDNRHPPVLDHPPDGKCSGITLPAIAKCKPNTVPILDTDPNECFATITVADMDNGSSDPINPSATPAETVVPPTAPGELGSSFTSAHDCRPCV
jgi:hypothetical protein